MDELLLGLSLGLGAGLAPGPLLALVLGATAERGFAAGARIACAPLLSDVPIIVLCVLVLGQLPDAALGALGVAGGLFVVHLGIDALRRRGHEARTTTAAGDLRRGALVNALSPHPWLFWLGAGGPIVLDAGGAVPAAGFLAGFYVLLVGSKLALAAVVARHGRRPGTATVAAVLLVAAGVALVVEGVVTIW